MSVDTNQMDNKILDILSEGRATPAYISERTGYNRSNIVSRLSRLVENDVVRKVHRGLYEKPEVETNEDSVDDPLRNHSPGSFYNPMVKDDSVTMAIVDKNHSIWEITPDSFIRRAVDKNGEPIGSLPSGVSEEHEQESLWV